MSSESTHNTRGGKPCLGSSDGSKRKESHVEISRLDFKRSYPTVGLKAPCVWLRRNSPSTMREGSELHVPHGGTAKFHLTTSLWWHPFSASLHTSLSLSAISQSVYTFASWPNVYMRVCLSQQKCRAGWVCARERGGETSICLFVLTRSAHRLRGNAHANQDLSPSSQSADHTNRTQKEGVGGHPAQLFQSGCHNHMVAIFLAALSLQLPALKNPASRSARVNNLDPWRYGAAFRWKDEKRGGNALRYRALAKGR